MEGLQQPDHLLLQHAGHQPLAAFLARLVERIDRHGDGDAVLRVAGLVQVSRRTVDAAQPDLLRERGSGDPGRFVTHQFIARQHQQAGLPLDLVPIPALERMAAVDIGRNLLGVEVVDQFVVDEDILAPRLVLQLLHLRDRLPVRGGERQRRVPVAGDECLADEDLACAVRIDLRERDPAIAVDRDAVERGPFERNDLRRLLLPVRVEQLRLDHVTRDARQPLRLDRRDPATVEARGLDQFGRDDPAAGLLRQVRTGVPVEADAARSEIPLVVVALQPDVAEQPRQHRQMDLLVARRRPIDPPAVLGNDRMELRVDVAPLADPARRDEVVAQQLLLLAIGEPVRTLGAAARLEPLPQVQGADEFRLLVVEFPMRLIGALRLFERPVAHILDAERTRDHQHLGEGLAVARFENHPADPWIERQLGEFAADRRQRVGVVDRAQFGQQLVAVGDRPARRGVEERKVLDRSEPECLHAQDHAGQRRAQDLRIGEARPLREVGLVVEPDADAVADPAAPPCPLVRRRLADRLDEQLLDLVAVAVALDPRRAGIDHVADAGNRQRGLRHVRRQHDAARAVRFEHAVLLLLVEAREQRHDLDTGRVMPTQVLGGLADLAFAGQEDQHVAAAGRPDGAVGAAAPELVDRIADRVVQAVVAAFLGTVASAVRPDRGGRKPRSPVPGRSMT